ncbi:MAG: tetratricopeptide repeat protein [Candidatus Dormiibacterota bacterium]
MTERLDRRLVAVMFTDVVGYTALMQHDEQVAVDTRDRYMSAVQRHHDAFQGTIVQRLGDGTMSMFPSALDAVLAAVGLQTELNSSGIAARIGIHVGDVVVERERLTGDAVNIAARIESFAVPGGVMLSDSASEQVKNRGDVNVVSMGRFRLKNVGRPFEIFAVAADGIVVPDAHALEGKGDRYAGQPSNLPEAITRIIGRGADLASLIELVRKHRVVTITGPGGVGKTRMLIELGRQLASEFLEGIAFVTFADVAEPESVVPALADALDVKEAEGRTLIDGVVALIGDTTPLLLLDNMEQVVAAAPHLAELVERCPGLRIVTTSRTPLRIAAERDYTLAPLAVPSVSDSTSTESLLACAAVALFVERAQTVRGSFELTTANAEAVVAICRRLDGLPLALELAAARLRLLGPEALLERLNHALEVLTSGTRDAPRRQQTLRATIEWSHSLLSESEQRLFRRMAVFLGGGTVGDLEAVCADPEQSILDDVESLVDKALVQIDSQDERLRMLQTIHEYARERLEQSGESDTLALRHARRYAERTHEIRIGVEGRDQVRSVERGIGDDVNIVAALDTLLAAARNHDAAACESGLRMCGDLFLYWHIRGKNLTAREYAQSFLDADSIEAPDAGRAGALLTAGLASWTLGQFERSNDELLRAYTVGEEANATREVCCAAWMAGLAQIGFDLDAGFAWASTCIERSRATGFSWGEGMGLTVEGILHSVAGDVDAAHARYLEALEIQSRIGDQEGSGLSLGGLAQLASIRGDLVDALALYRQSLSAFEAIGDRAEEARILSEMAWAHLQHGDTELARAFFFDSVRAYTDIASVRGVGLSLVGLAATEAVEHRPYDAVRIAAAAEVYAQQEGIVNVYSDETPGQQFVEEARSALPADQLDRATREGRKLTIKEALDLARAAEPVSAKSTGAR